MLTDATLLTALERLNVHFVAGQSNIWHEANIPPDELLCGLASHKEARMRLALFPIFLTNPSHARYVNEALFKLTSEQQHIMRCRRTYPNHTSPNPERHIQQPCCPTFEKNPCCPVLQHLLATAQAHPNQENRYQK